MPLAFDFTSTLDLGWIFPVATTDFAMSPRSTPASFDGSIVLFGFSADLRANPPPANTAIRTPKTTGHLRLRFPFDAITEQYATTLEMFRCRQDRALQRFRPRSPKRFDSSIMSPT